MESLNRLLFDLAWKTLFILGLSSWASINPWASLIITCTRYPYAGVPAEYNLVISPRVLACLEESSMCSLHRARHSFLSLFFWPDVVLQALICFNCMCMLTEGYWHSRPDSLEYRAQLTAHLGETILAFNQVRVPGLEAGTYWTDSTQAVVGLTDSFCSLTFDT